MSRFSVALIQIAMRDDEPAAARLERGIGLIEKLDRPVRLVMLPELWTAGFFNFDQYQKLAEPLDGPTVARLSATAARGKFWLHGGSLIERSSDGNLHNTSLLFNPAGVLVATYRKMHLFGYESGEKAILHPGEAPVNIPSEIGNLAPTTCYDMRFPELYRCLSRRGAELALITSAWPAARLEHWVVLARARAIENLFYVLACNAAGSNRGHELAGNSMIIDPWGKVVAQAPAEESVLCAEIDPAEVAAVRAEFPALRDRREGCFE
jgi:predicted amidohydrolase